jgi:catechol 2,3-dioxygenase-like lactoylglutathione lyase family enzyme
MASVRYIVDDVDDAVAFYAERLGFDVEMHVPAGFAMLDRDDLRLLLSRPGAGGAGHPSDDGRPPSPGGWARFQLLVDDLDGELATLTGSGVRVRTGIVEGVGGRQAVIEDPSGNAVELFELPQGEPG